MLKAIHFRDGPTPRQGRPLVIPLLAHHAFIIELKSWVRKKVLNAKPYLPPFHVPKATIVAGKNPALHQLVYNHFQFMESCHWGTPPDCLVVSAHKPADSPLRGQPACSQSCLPAQCFLPPPATVAPEFFWSGVHAEDIVPGSWMASSGQMASWVWHFRCYY